VLQNICVFSASLRRYLKGLLESRLPAKFCRYCVGSEVITAVLIKTSVFWNITPQSQLKVNRRFGIICSYHLQGRRVIQAKLLAACFMPISLFDLIFSPEFEDDMFSGVLSQKKELFCRQSLPIRRLCMFLPIYHPGFVAKIKITVFSIVQFSSFPTTLHWFPNISLRTL
jgi:hypothetical protein